MKWQHEHGASSFLDHKRQDGCNGDYEQYVDWPRHSRRHIDETFMTSWHLITNFGSSINTMSMALFIAMGLVANMENRMAFYWCTLFGAAMLLVVVTKIGFIGWGVGMEAIDFTGISGHATRAAAVYPVLFFLIFQRAPERLNVAPVCAGVAVGILISVSRFAVHVHSVSEILAGWMLGSAIGGLFLYRIKGRELVIPRVWLVLAGAVLVVAMPLTGQLQSDGMITRLALALSGRERPFTRTDWKAVQPVREPDRLTRVPWQMRAPFFK